MISFGRVIRARAIDRRWRWPPENSCGYLSMSAACSPTSCQGARHALAPLRAVGLLLEQMQRLGDEAFDLVARVEGAEGILEHPPACCGGGAAEAASLLSESSSPRRRIDPDVGRSSARIMRASVDFPQPERPTSATDWPSLRSKDTPSTARNGSALRNSEVRRPG